MNHPQHHLEQDRPTTCRYDRSLGYRVTTEHYSDCTDPAGHRGCVPCPEPHCTSCGRAHCTHDHPLTCPTCIGNTRGDLAEIRTSYAGLAREALEAGRDGRLVAAAPIPGGRAQVLIGPTVRLDDLRMSRQLHEDHLRDDPIPPLAILAQWEDLWRSWLDHRPGRARSTVAAAVDYLALQLDYMAQQTEGPEYPAFARQVRVLRSQLERALHDEREPEHGVECFECGERLSRRFRRATPCHHDTPARLTLGRWNTQHADQPDAGQPPLTLLREAMKPCGACDQGGIEDPAAGQSWECLACGKDYDPGEYAAAVRRDLLENGTEGDGWTHVTMAADAASTLVGQIVPAATVRKWMDREKVASCCRWEPGARFRIRLVYWPDVADLALALKARRRAS